MRTFSYMRTIVSFIKTISIFILGLICGLLFTLKMQMASAQTVNITPWVGRGIYNINNTKNYTGDFNSPNGSGAFAPVNNPIILGQQYAGSFTVTDTGATMGSGYFVIPVITQNITSYYSPCSWLNRPSQADITIGFGSSLWLNNATNVTITNFSTSNHELLLTQTSGLYSYACVTIYKFNAQFNFASALPTGAINVSVGINPNDVSYGSVQLLGQPNATKYFLHWNSAPLNDFDYCNKVGTTSCKPLFQLAVGSDPTQLQLQDLNDKTQTLIDQSKETNKNLKDINESIKDQTQTQKDTNDFLKDDTAPDNDISSLGNVQGIFPPGPVDSLLNIPFNLLSSVVSSFAGQCKPISMKTMGSNTWTFPCFNEMIYGSSGIIGSNAFIINLVSLVPAAFILIKYFKHLYKKVDRATSMQSNSDDEWGGV